MLLLTLVMIQQPLVCCMSMHLLGVLIPLKIIIPFGDSYIFILFARSYVNRVHMVYKCLDGLIHPVVLYI